MFIRVAYYNNKCDTIPDFILQLGIDCKKIKMFYRNSERRWITAGVDPIRNTRISVSYAGPERRGPQISERPFLNERIASQVIEIERQLS